MSLCTCTVCVAFCDYTRYTYSCSSTKHQSRCVHVLFDVNLLVCRNVIYVYLRLCFLFSLVFAMSSGSDLLLGQAVMTCC